MFAGIVKHMVATVKKILKRIPIIRKRIPAWKRFWNRMQACVRAFRENSAEAGFCAPTEAGQSRDIVLSDNDVIYLFVDHTVDYFGNTGVQRVTRLAAIELLRSASCVRFVKWSDQTGDFVFITLSERNHLAAFNGPAAGADEKAFYAQHANTPIPYHYRCRKIPMIVPEIPWMAARKKQITGEILRRIKIHGLLSCFIFYDDIPLHRYELREISPKHINYMTALSDADKIIAISETSRNALLKLWERMKIDEYPEVTVLYLPADHIGSVRAAGTYMPDRRSILSVGSVTPHKNQLALCQAFAEVIKKNPELKNWSLTLAGAVDGRLHPQITELKSKCDIRFGLSISDEELLKLYQGCAFTVFPSLEEGYGLPIVESLWNGRPCLCANFGAMGELAKSVGYGCLTVDTRNLDALTDALERLMKDRMLLESLTGKTASARLLSRLEWGEKLLKIVKDTPRKPNRPRRIFYLCMHKILLATELEYLRDMGYEVFVPPYISNVEEQSAVWQWDYAQESTLPREVFMRLADYRFFFNENISDEMMDLLNEYFDVLFITIVPAWLSAFMRKFTGRIIYRIYGTAWVNSAVFSDDDLTCIQSLPDFVFSSTSRESLDGNSRFKGQVYCESWNKGLVRERDFFRKNAVIIPYAPTNDVFRMRNVWNINDTNGEIAMMCPNLKNPYYLDHFKYLKKNFPEKYCRYYGMQLSDEADENLVGTLPREELLERFRRSCGFMYTFREPWTLYLQPVEMIVMGVPVLYFAGSLLDSFVRGDNPGCCKDEAEAKEKMQRLLNKDISFINAVIASERQVIERYDPEKVKRIFEQKIRTILEEPSSETNMKS